MFNINVKRILTAVLCAVMVMAVAIPAFTADKIIDTEIKTMAVKNDKNGNEFCRFIIVESKELSGVKYKADTVVMVFGADLVEQAKTYSEGTKLKAIVATNEYKGRVNYNLIAFVN